MKFFLRVNFDLAYMVQINNINSYNEKLIGKD
jgi:hypothetical protein